MVKAYEAIEVAVTAHDEKTWAYHVADEFVGIGRRYTGTPDTKGGRLGQIGVSNNRADLAQDALGRGRTSSETRPSSLPTTSRWASRRFT